MDKAGQRPEELRYLVRPRLDNHSLVGRDQQSGPTTQPPSSTGPIETLKMTQRTKSKARVDGAKPSGAAGRVHGHGEAETVKKKSGKRSEAETLLGGGAAKNPPVNFS